MARIALVRAVLSRWVRRKEGEPMGAGGGGRGVNGLGLGIIYWGCRHEHMDNGSLERRS